jgi:integrase
MRNHRLGAWIGHETYRDRKTGKRMTCATWTVKYPAFDAGPGDYRSVRERGFATRDDATAWWLEQKKNGGRHVAKAEVVKEAPITVGEFLERWLKTIRNSIGSGALHQYESHAREHLIPSLGHLLLLDLERGPQVVEEAMAAWKRKDGREGDLSPLFVKKVWSTLRTACNKAKKLRLITSNPCDFIDPPKVERKEMNALSPAQVGDYLAAFDGTDIGAAIAIALGSGCRRGELLGLRWRDVDLERGTLRVERSVERVAIRTAKRVRYETRFKEPKSRRSRRTIPLPPFAVERLRKHRVDQAQRLLTAGIRPDGDTIVFDRDGLPWNPGPFGMLFTTIRDAAGLPKVRLHDLRHSYASLLLQSGADLKTVSTALGHSSVAITADTYVHISPVMLQSAADRLNDLIQSRG